MVGKRLLWVGILSIMSLGVAHARSRPSSAGSWVVVRNNRLGFQIKIPKHWYVKTSQDSVGFTNQNQVTVWVSKMDGSSHSGIHYPKGAVEVPTVLAGYRALKVIVSSGKESKIKIIEYNLATRNGHYRLQCISPYDRNHPYDDLLQTIVQSFKLI